jgi:hypothetical protein
LKLAEALSIKADLQRKVAQLKERILRNAKIQVRGMFPVNWVKLNFGEV